MIFTNRKSSKITAPFRFLLFTVFLFAPNSGFSSVSGNLIIYDNLTGKDIGKYLDYFEDTSQRLTISEIASGAFDNRFMPSDKDRLGFGYSRSVYWIRIRIENTTDRDISWLLECGYNMLDHITFYKSVQNGFNTIETGDRTPFNTRPLPEKTFVFPVKSSPGTDSLYLKISSEGSLAIPLIAWMPEVFRAEKEKEDILLWIALGILIALIFYNLIIYFSVKEISYIYLVLTIISFIFFSLTNCGLAYKYLWPHSPDWNNSCYPFFTFLITTGTLLFTRSFLSTGKNIPYFDRIYKTLAAVCALCVLLPFVIDYYYSIQIAVITSIISSLAMIAGGAVVMARKLRPAYFYMISWSFFVIGALLFLFRVYAVIPENALTAWSFQVGFVIMALLFSLGIADNINTISNERGRALEAFKASEEKFRAIFENASEGIFQTSPRGRVFTANLAAAKILGFDSPEELKSTAPDIGVKLFNDKEIRDNFEKQMTDRGEVRGFELRTCKKDGSQIFLNLNAHSVYDIKGKLQYYEGMIEDITRKKEAEELDRKNIILREQMILDGLTGLYTHKYMIERLSQKVSESKRYGNTLSIALIDIDFFKRINDRYGHPMGDKIINGISEAMKNNTREVDILGRYGGEEFLVIFPNTGARESYICTERMRIKIENLTWDYDITTTVSGGIAAWEGENTDDFIKKADRYLHIAKHSGRNRIEM